MKHTEHTANELLSQSIKSKQADVFGYLVASGFDFTEAQKLAKNGKLIETYERVKALNERLSRVVTIPAFY